MNKISSLMLSSGNRLVSGLFFVLFCFCSSISNGQTNIALTAVPAHSSGGGAGSPDYSAVNYNDGFIAANSGLCASSATPWAWLNTGGWISFTWSSPVTFDKVVLYKSNRPMQNSNFEYWNGLAFVPFLAYSSGTCTEDSVSFPPITTTIFRINNISGTASNPNHREIQVWSTPTTPCTSPTNQPTALSFTPGIFNITGNFTAATSAPERYLTVMTTSSTPPSSPVDGVNYIAGTSALGGVIVGSSPATSFTATGLTPGTTYWYWVYSANVFCLGGPLYYTVTPLSGTVATNVCGLSGTKTVGPTGDYATLAAAITGLNNNGLAGPVVLEIQTTYAGEPLPVTIGNLPCISAVNTVTIRPQGVLNLAGPVGMDMIILDGARYITIDGRIGSTGTTKSLTLANQSVTGSVIRFINGASNNTIKYCRVLGENTNIDNANILFSTSTAATGNNDNTIDNCDIMDDGIGTPVHCVFSEGVAGKENSGNTISNCNIANFFNPTVSSKGVFLSTASTTWTITNNRFYQTVARAYTGTALQNVISIANGTTGNGFVVTNNIIGFSSSAGTGTYTSSSSTTTTFQAILMLVADAVPSLVQGNTIKNFSYSATTGLWTGISVSDGSVNIIGNTVGATTGTGSIVKTNSSTASPAVVGINSDAPTPSIVNIQNNNIGAITTNGSTATIGAGIHCITASSTATTTITGNMIGSLTTANSINSASVSTGTQNVAGIAVSMTSGTTADPIISNNTIMNLNQTGTGTGSVVSGIIFTSTASGVITNNLIRNISGSSANVSVTAQSAISGISYTGATGTANISQNTINAIAALNTAAVGNTATGIFLTSSVEGVISRNRIYDIRNASTGTTATTPPKVVGVFCYNPNTSATIVNNMISLGNGQTTNTAFTGIMQGSITGAAQIRIYHNTINIEGTAASGALASVGILRGNYSATVYNTPFDVKNNIVNNIRTGGTGKHYAIGNILNGVATATGWGANASNYNILNAAAATVGFWGGDRTIANWKVASAGDVNSFSASAVTFSNVVTGDLHINMGVTANNIEAHGTAISGVNTDYDNQVRPGPTSVNGGGFAPDLGADEFDGVPNENLPPVITHTALLNACGTGDRTFTANIFDPSGVAVGATRPRVYYKKGLAGGWFSSAGTFVSGSTWTFTIVAADMGGLAVGDQVFYYIIAQDVPGNVGSNPSGVVATNVNTIGTPPLAPNMYTTQQALGGSYNVGLSGDYTTITAAIASYHGSCLSGPVTFNLTDATYPTETFPITINASVFSSSVNTLTIKPAPGVSPAITGTATPALIILNGADYVILDGSNNPVANTICPMVSATRNLTITNTSTSTASAVVWLRSTATDDGATNNIIRNCNIFGNANTQTLFGIGSGSTTVSATSVGTGNNFNRIENNSINACQNGIYTRGASATEKNEGNVINQNVIAGAGPANNVTDNGIMTGFENNITISGNYIANVANTAAQDLIGISLGINSNTILATSVTGVEVTNATVTHNRIDNLATPATVSSTIGIAAFGPASGVNTIANNMISNVGGKQTGSDLAAGIYVFGSLSGGTTNLYYNSIKLGGIFTGGTVGSFGIAINGVNPIVNLRNNIVVNNILNGSAFRYAIGIGFNGATNITSNYNNFFINGGNFGVVGSLTIAGVVSPTLAEWQTNTGFDINSKNANPTFASSTDLHVTPVLANAAFMNAGTPVSVTTDIDCAARNGSTPDIGANEFNVPNCTLPVTGVATPVASSFCNAGVTTINAVGVGSTIGTTYQWQTSTDSASWSPISGATTASFTIPSPIASTTFYRIKVGCTFTSTFDSSTAKVTVISNPANITGLSAMCVSSAYTLATTASGGTWSSSDIGVVTVNASGNVTTTATGGAANISYTLGNGCSAVKTIVVSNTMPVVTAPATPATICAGESSVLNGAFTNPGASSYVINSISYAPQAFTPTGTFTSVSPLTAGNLDDGFYAVPLPFDFEYYGTSYAAGTDAYIGINGYMTFGTGIAVASFIGSIPNVVYPSTISLFGIDLDLNFSGSITYGVTGVAPNRKFVVSYNNVPDWRNDVPNSLFESGQIILNETSNSIELHVGTLLGVSNHSIGIQSNAGAQSSAVSGQNNVVSSVYASAWQFSSVAPSFSWTADPTLSATNTLTPTAGPLNTSTTYTLTATASNGCTANAATLVSVNPLPALISGVPQVCQGFTTPLSNTVSGGTWISENTTVATIDANMGVVSGLTPGTSTISYALTATGCTRTVIFTVNPTPTTITGSNQVCVEASATIVNTDAGGTWISGNLSIVTVEPGTGVMTGVLAGTADVTYILPTGCKRSTTVSVNPLPALSVTPSTPVTFCLGESTSAYTAAATMPGFSLLNQNFNGTLAGWTVESNIGLPSGQWQIVPIGFDFATTGDGTPMLQASPAVSGGQVHSIVSSPSFSTVGFGTATLTFNYYVLTDADPVVAVQYSIDGGSNWLSLTSYTGALISGNPTWTAATPDATIPLPAGAINQPDVRLRWNYDASFYAWFIDNIRVNAELPPATYTWTGGSDLSCTTCTNPVITPSVSGTNLYTVTATSSASCTSNAMVTLSVNPFPAVIGGSMAICQGQVTTLTNVDADGTWTSTNTGVATIVAGTGVVNGLTAGTTEISYILPTGCLRTAILTVNALPAAIGGNLAVCMGLTTLLTDATPDGTWASSNSTVATIDANTGLATASDMLSGNVTITYALTATGCARTAQLTVNPLPGIFVGATQVCVGSTAIIASIGGGGTWTSSNTSVATIGSTTGLISGLSDGNTMLTYTLLATGCRRFVEATVNPLPANITGAPGVCQGLSTVLVSSPAGGMWGSSNTAVADVDGSGIVTAHVAGNSLVSYQLPTGCKRTVEVTVNPLPAAIGGTLAVCAGLSTELTNATPDGTWNSDNTTVATIGGTGIVLGVQAGNSNITYTVTATGCIRSAEVTVNPLPAVITGTFEVCAGLTTELSTATSGGSWISGNTTVADINTSGIVSGHVAGTSMVSYQLPTGCRRTTVVAVNPLPALIGGTLDVCAGLTTALSNATAGGTWISGNTTVATINSSGVASGLQEGNSTITYRVTATGCIRTAALTVNPLPQAITGVAVVCEGGNTVLENITPSGTWSSSNTAMATIGSSTAMATIGSSTGAVVGVSAGTPIMTYRLSTGCISTRALTVNPLPAVITGGLQVCEGLTTTLSSATSGGNWISSSTGNATIGVTSGVVSGVSAGESAITYVFATSCMRVVTVTVNATPATISGPSQVCATSSIALTDATTGGAWSSSAPGVAAVGGTGIVSGMLAGNATITYMLPTSCMTTHDVTVNALPVAYAVTGGGNYCFGGAGMPVGVANSETGITYNLYNGSTMVGSQPGTTGSAVDFGAMFAGGIYTVSATSSASCNRNMTGMATITVVPLVTPMVTLGLSPNDTVCAGTSVTFTATSVNGGTTPGYVWTVNGSPVTSTTATHIYTPADGDVIGLTMTSTEACPSPATASATQSMVVMPNLTPTITIATPNSTLCQGSIAAYTATGTVGGTTPVITWYKNTVSTGITGSVYAYNPLNGDVVSARLNSSYRCPTINNVASNNITMKMDSVFIPVVDIYTNTGGTIKWGQNVTFTAAVSKGGGVPTYQWFVNSTLMTGSTAPTYTTNKLVNGDSVTCFVYGTGQCSYSTFNSLKVRVTTGFVQAATTDADLRLIPNPNTGEFAVNGTLSTSAATEVSLEVTDMLGQVVYRNKVMTSGGTINERVKLSNTLANGMYMLNVRTGADNKVFHFVVKQ